MEDNEITPGICSQQIVWNNIILEKMDQIVKRLEGLICRGMRNDAIQQFALPG